MIITYYWVNHVVSSERHWTIGTPAFTHSWYSSEATGESFKLSRKILLYVSHYFVYVPSVVNKWLFGIFHLQVTAAATGDNSRDDVGDDVVVVVMLWWCADWQERSKKFSSSTRQEEEKIASSSSWTAVYDSERERAFCVIDSWAAADDDFRRHPRSTAT